MAGIVGVGCRQSVLEARVLQLEELLLGELEVKVEAIEVNLLAFAEIVHHLSALCAEEDDITVLEQCLLFEDPVLRLLLFQN